MFIHSSMIALQWHASLELEDGIESVLECLISNDSNSKYKEMEMKNILRVSMMAQIMAQSQEHGGDWMFLVCSSMQLL